MAPSRWGSLGGTWKGDPVITSTYGVLDVFVRGSDDSLWFQSELASGWTGWTGPGGRIFGNPAAAFNGDGRLEAFAIGTDHALWHIAQAYPGSNQWTNWNTLGGCLAGDSVSPVLDLISILNVFALGGDLGLWETSQIVPGVMAASKFHSEPRRTTDIILTVTSPYVPMCKENKE